MRSEIVQRRMKEVLRVDSINSSQGDFLASHVPFQKMIVVNGHDAMQTRTEISEEAVFQNFFDNPEMADQHQLMIVEGASGAGKSHFIRWIHARLKNLGDPNEVILLIRRSDNTLKGTIKQLLAIDEVQGIQNREVYERLVRANQAISEQKLKAQIYHRFLAEIQSDEEDEILNASRRKGLYALLSNSFFEAHMMESGGAVERIFNKVTSSENANNQDTVAQFDSQDFVLTADFVEEMESAGADRKAVKLANWLIPNEEDGQEHAQRIADYLNQHVEEVIQSCAGIESGDFEQIFKEIRQELKRKGKKLTLLIEDITSFTGINQALLNVLITEHTGMNETDQMCRLVSVVGTTSEYYKQFRDNYRDRISTQITLQDESIGEQQLLLFVAKYLNVMSLESETITEWMRNGAREEDYPIHQVSEGENWDYVLYQHKKLSLYPFTKNAVKNLYNRMGITRTPRYILRDIVEPAVHDIIENRSGFPAFCKGIRSGLSETVDSRINNLVRSLPISEEEQSEYRSRVSFLIGIWGNGTLESGSNTLSGLSVTIFKELGLQGFYNIIFGQIPASMAAKQHSAQNSVSVVSDPIIKNPPADEAVSAARTVQADPEQQKRQKAYDDFYKLAANWHFENGIFADKLVTSGIREAINDFVISAVNWQQEGISLQTVAYIRDSDKRMIGFANQNRGKDQMLVKLENTEENYQLLLAFGKWVHLGKKSWDFVGAETAIYHATRWLTLYLPQIIDAVKGTTQPPLYLKCAMIAELYRKILNGEYTGASLKALKTSDLLSAPAAKNASGHSEKWSSLLDSIYLNPEQMKEIQRLSVQYFNLIQGTSERSSKYLLKYTELQAVLRELRASGLTLTSDELSQRDVIAKREEIIQFVRGLLPRLDTAAKAEQDSAQALFHEIVGFFGFEEDDEIDPSDIRELLDNILLFYQEAERYGVNLAFANKYQTINELKSNAASLANVISALNTADSDLTTLSLLLHFANNPMRRIMPLMNILRQTAQDVERVVSQKETEKEELKRKGGWSEHKDPRFADEKVEFDALLAAFEEVNG